MNGRLVPDGTQLCVAVVALCSLPVIEAVECLRAPSQRCSSTEVCCGTACCPKPGPFYAHWYFWLAMGMLLLVVVGFAISACRHYRNMRRQGAHQTTTAAGRSKPKLSTDLLLNYHLMRTDAFGDHVGSHQRDVLVHEVSLPLYYDVTAAIPSYDDVERGRHVTFPTASWLPLPLTHVMRLHHPQSPVRSGGVEDISPPPYDYVTT